MRILSRPMFKYGGPIKEGVMHGMKNGGLSKQFNTGLVGDERYPKTGGREHHWFFLPALGSLALGTAARVGIPMAARAAGSATVRRLASEAATRAALTGGAKETVKKVASTPGGWKNLFKNYWSGDPAVKGAKWTAKTLTSPGANTLAQKTVRGLLSPSSLALSGGAAWMFWPDGTPKTKEEIAATGGKPGEKWSPGVGGEQYDPSTSPSAMAAAAKKARKAKIAKYMDTMGYDQAKRGAIGKALIDASAIVQAGTEEGGSLKHADWSKMINQAIQATSKRLEKPEQIREAVGLMMTKAGIEKDMTAEADALAKRKLNLQIKELSEKIDPSAADLALAMGDKADKQGMMENIVKSVEGVENLKASFKNIKDTDYGDWKKLKKNKNKPSIDFMKEIIEPSGAMVPGFYVFPERTVEVTDDLTIKWYL
jgi:hypothetical protein